MAEGIFENLNQTADEVMEQAAPSRNHLKDIGFDSSRITQFRETWKEAVKGLGENAGLALSEIAAGVVGNGVLMELGGRLRNLAYNWEIPTRSAQDTFAIVLPFLQPPAAARIPTVQSVALDTLSTAAYISAEAAIVAGLGYATWKHGKNLITHGLSWYQLQREQKTREKIAVAERGQPQINLALLEGPEQLGKEAIRKILPPQKD